MPWTQSQTFANNIASDTDNDASMLEYDDNDTLTHSSVFAFLRTDSHYTNPYALFNADIDTDLTQDTIANDTDDANGVESVNQMINMTGDSDEDDTDPNILELLKIQNLLSDLF